jgi:uncharacterized membrane protein YdjX (TVP38/TMEM64 family)
MSDETSSADDAPKGAWVRHLPLALIAVATVTAALTLGDRLTFATLDAHREALLAFRDAHLVATVALFLGAYILIVVLSLPGAAVASVTGGFLFGLTFGTALNVAAATLGASLLFLAARWGLGDRLAARIDASEGTVKRLKTRLHENEVSVLLLLRLIPVVPFFVANLLPALVGVRFGRFLWTTAVGIVPGGLVYTWIGVGVGEVLSRGGRPDLSLIWEPHVIGPILGLATLAALPMMLRAVRGKPGV